MRSSKRSRYQGRLDRHRWAAVRLEVLERDGYRCRACGRAGRLEVDHIVPMYRGGNPYDLAGLQALCVACHIAKSRRENPARRDPSPQAKAWARCVAELR